MSKQTASVNQYPLDYGIPDLGRNHHRIIIGTWTRSKSASEKETTSVILVFFLGWSAICTLRAYFFIWALKIPPVVGPPEMTCVTLALVVPWPMCCTGSALGATLGFDSGGAPLLTYCFRCSLWISSSISNCSWLQLSVDAYCNGDIVELALDTSLGWGPQRGGGSFKKVPLICFRMCDWAAFWGSNRGTVGAHLTEKDQGVEYSSPFSSLAEVGLKLAFLSLLEFWASLVFVYSFILIIRPSKVDGGYSEKGASQLGMTNTVGKCCHRDVQAVFLHIEMLHFKPLKIKTIFSPLYDPH